MKFGQVVRVSEDKRLTRDKIREYLNANPGASSKEIAKDFNYYKAEDVHKIARYLYQMTKSNVDPIQKRLLDGKMRYYPHNYNFADQVASQHLAVYTAPTTKYRCLDCGREFEKAQALRMHRQRKHEGMLTPGEGGTKPRGVVPPLPVSQPVKLQPKEDVVDLARQYYWLKSDDSLHGFVDWLTENNITE